jgi:hypothetical protein
MATNKKESDKKQPIKILTKEEKELLKKLDQDKKQKLFSKETILK